MENKILVYDDNCPMCKWYSGLFVKFGFLQTEGRKPFSVLDTSLLAKIDFDKSRNEIPLLDTETGKVIYGIDALLEILDKKIPFIKTAGNLLAVKWVLKKLYKLISYNRKVIVAKKCSTGTIDCAPDLNYRYRFIFMLSGLLLNTAMLHPIHWLLLSELSYYKTGYLDLQAAHFTLVLSNCLLALNFSKQKAVEYLGQVNMLAILAMLMLCFLLIIRQFYFDELLVTILLIAVSVIIFREYFRRMEYAGVLQNNKWVISLNMLCLFGFILFLFH